MKGTTSIARAAVCGRGVRCIRGMQRVCDIRRGAYSCAQASCAVPGTLLSLSRPLSARHYALHHTPRSQQACVQSFKTWRVYVMLAKACCVANNSAIWCIRHMLTSTQTSSQAARTLNWLSEARTAESPVDESVCLLELLVLHQQSLPSLRTSRNWFSPQNCHRLHRRLLLCMHAPCPLHRCGLD